MKNRTFDCVSVCDDTTIHSTSGRRDIIKYKMKWKNKEKIKQQQEKKNRDIKINIYRESVKENK